MFHLLKMTNQRCKINIIAKTSSIGSERAGTAADRPVVKDRRTTQELSSSGSRSDSSRGFKQWGHGWVNTCTHSYTLTHNLRVTRAGFHDNRQAEWERKKKEGAKSSPCSSEHEVTCENDVLSNSGDKEIKQLVEVGGVMLEGRVDEDDLE